MHPQPSCENLAKLSGEQVLQNLKPLLFNQDCFLLTQMCGDSNENVKKLTCWFLVRLNSQSGSFQPVWPEKNHQISIKVAQKWFHKKNEKLPKNVGEQILPQALKSFHEVQ